LASLWVVAALWTVTTPGAGQADRTTAFRPPLAGGDGNWGEAAAGGAPSSSRRAKPSRSAASRSVEVNTFIVSLFRVGRHHARDLVGELAPGAYSFRRMRSSMNMMIRAVKNIAGSFR
jgi:hypothetical protein